MRRTLPNPECRCGRDAFKTGHQRPALRACFLWEIDLFGVAPEALEVVKISGVFVEDVYDEVAVIEQDPFGRIVALGANDAGVQLLLQLLGDLVGDRLHLPLVGAAGDNEKFGETGDIAEVEATPDAVRGALRS